MKPVISTTVFGFLNYVMGLVTMASPWLFGFEHQRGASLLLPLYLGWLTLIMAVFSKNRLGCIRVFPVSMHCFLYTIEGFFLMCSPFLYGYYTNQIFIPQLLCGLILLLMGLLTEHSPLTDAPHHVFKDGLLNSTADVDEEMGH